MKIAVELLLILVLLLSVYSGYKKGLVMCIGAILAIILSLYMGNLLSDTFSHEAIPVVRPFASGYMEGTEGIIGDKLNELLASSEVRLSVDDALERYPDIEFELAENSFKEIGIYEETAKAMANEAIALSERTGYSLPNAIVEVLCEKITYVVGFILFFLLILIILTVLGNIFNLSFKIPEKDKLNDIGGLIAGAVTGLLFCSIAVWCLRFMGMLLPEEEMRKTLLTSLFMKLDFLSKFLPI